MPCIQLVLVSSAFLNSDETRSLVRSANIPIRTLDRCVDANKGGHLPMRPLLSAEQMLNYGIVVPNEALIVITEDDKDAHSCLLQGSSFPIECLGATVIAISKRDVQNAEAIAELLAPHGDFKIEELATA